MSIRSCSGHEVESHHVSVFQMLDSEIFKMSHFVVSVRSLTQLSAVDETVARRSDTNALPRPVFCGKSPCAHTSGLHHHTVSRLTTFLC
jgi:hypothetical protein